MNNARSFRAGSIAAAVAWLAGISMTVVSKGMEVQATETVEQKDRLLGIVGTQTDLLLRYMGLDLLFVTGYLTVFAVLFLCTGRSDRLVAGLGLAGGILAGLCDTLENTLYVVYGLGALHGNMQIVPELPFHYYLSTLKWMSAFSAVGFLVLVFPRNTRFERIISLVMLTLPLGGALSIAFPALAPLRALFFVVGFPLFAIYFFRRARTAAIEGTA